MRTLIVEPSVLERVANRLDRLADRHPIDPRALRETLADLDRSWTGGIAADLAKRCLCRLIRIAGAAAEMVVMDFDPSGDGRLVVSFGDPRTCHNVATYVPGAGVTLDSVGGELERARLLRERAGPDTAVVMWLGYDPPDFADAIFERAARAGSEPLRRFQADLVANHDGAIGQLTLIGHSYGAVVIGVAEREGDLAADDIVVLGAPGMGVSRAAQLRDPTQIWASMAGSDPIRHAPGFILGRDPDNPKFGAQTITSARFGHCGYFRQDNPALTTVAAIANGTHLT